MSKAHQILTDARDFLEYLQTRLDSHTHTPDSDRQGLKRLMSDIDEILKQPDQELVACPYPCGWDNLYSFIVKKGAYLAQSTMVEDEIFTSHQRNEMVRIIDYAKKLCEWGKNTRPPKREPLSDDDIAKLWSEKFSGETLMIRNFARAIEKAHGISDER